MTLQLYRLPVECPRCGLRPPVRKTRHEVEAHKNDPPNVILYTLQCQAHQGGLRICTETIYVRAGHYRSAVLVESVEQPAAEFPPALLSPRQEEVYALVVQGKSDAKIAAALGVRPTSVRDCMAWAAKRMRQGDPSLPDTSPRRVLLAFHARATTLPSAPRLVA